MRLELSSDRVEIDTWLEDYLETTLLFSTWYEGGPTVDSVQVQLDAMVDEVGVPGVRCTLRADTLTRGPLCSGATGADVCEAVERASLLLEAALFGPSPQASPLAPRRLAA